MTSRPTITQVQPLGFPFFTPDPFLFCVYHKDNYPAGNNLMQAPRKGNGADFNPSAPYRMYHGDLIPGFPQHPHRGFETITATISGIIDHTDSTGCAGRYGEGDLQWVTAGKGIVHGEMFPLINNDKPNPTRFFQIWLNLPAADKMADPEFVMHWAEDIPILSYDDDKVTIRLWAGELDGHVSLPPPPKSWASKRQSFSNGGDDVAVLLISLKPGGKYALPASNGGSAVNRILYFVEGSTVSIAEQQFKEKAAITVDAGREVMFENPGNDIVDILVLQGKPIAEPVRQRGPFVMNTDVEIQQAYIDYSVTRFGGWPWPDDAMVFPREKGRFALKDGVEYYPEKI